VHRADCVNAGGLAQEQAGRMVEVEWDTEQRVPLWRSMVEVSALDRSRLLRDVADAMSGHHVNIVSCSTVTGDDRVAKMRFEFELANTAHLEAVLRTIKRIDGVYDVRRLDEPRGGPPDPVVVDDERERRSDGADSQTPPSVVSPR
jgi:GTP pyrophosphokinase